MQLVHIIALQMHGKCTVIARKINHKYTQVNIYE